MRRLGARLVALLMTASACGAATGGPVVVPSEDLPFDVTRQLEPSESPAPTTLQRVGFVRRETILRVPRRIPSDAPIGEALLRALLEGPTPQEVERGIETAIPSATRLLEVVIVDNVARVDLSEEFQQAASSETLALRVAQVVWTITEVPGVIAATFLIGGEEVTPVNDRGESVDRPVTRADYASFAPRR